MPRSSRHKSHKQSKHSSKDDREHSDSEEDVKMKDRNGNEDAPVRGSRDSMSGEKRKVSSQSRDGKDPSAFGNGDTAEEHVVSKRRKEKADTSADSDRWNGGGDERGDVIIVDKETKGESLRVESDRSVKVKASVDSKSRSSRRNDIGSDKKEENVSVTAEKDEGKTSSKVDLKRRSEKDSGGKEVHQGKDKKELKEKDRGSERERKVQDTKRDLESRSVDGSGKGGRKQGSEPLELGEELLKKRDRENTELPVQDEVRNIELEKELEKRIRKRKDGSSDKYQDNAREDDDRRLSSRGERGKDGKYKDERHKDGSHGDKNQEEDDRDNRHRDNKHREDGDRISKSRDEKYPKEGGRDNKRREDRYREDADRDNRHRDDKHREDGERDRRRDDKYREDGDRDSRRRDDRRGEDRYYEDGDSYNKHSDKYREDGERDTRHREDKYWKEGDKLNRHTEDRNQEDVDRDNRHRSKLRDDVDRDKRLRDVKYSEERTSRDDAKERSGNKRTRDESNTEDVHHRKSNNRDGSPVVDDHNSRYKDDKGRRRGNDKEDKEAHSDIRYHSTKEQTDSGKKSTTANIDIATDRGRSYSRNTDAEITLNRNKWRSSPSSSSHGAKDQYRLLKQEGSKYRDSMHEERAWQEMASGKEFGGASGSTEKAPHSQSLEKHFLKDDSLLGDLSVERRQRSDSRNSPLQLVDKSPSSSSTDRRHMSKSTARRSLDVEESRQKSGGSRDAKEYYDIEGRRSRELAMETLPGDELSQADGDTLSVSSPFTRPSRMPNNSRSLLPPPPPFRTGADNSTFGSFEDDKRGKSINRHRRTGDSNMGRAQGSPWKGIPNWPSPMANGFMPFQHGPPPVGFHPVMHQFPAPPMFGVRPPMELNHTPYHIPDADRFSSHGRPLGWRTPVDESCPPPLHGWESNHAAFGDESHMYGRPDWDQNRSLMNVRGWEASGDIWKGHNGGMKTELPAAPEKQDYIARGSPHEAWSSMSGQQIEDEQNQTGFLEEKVSISQSSDVQALSLHEAPKTVPEKKSDISKASKMDGDRLWRIYLSKLDISANLTRPELYNQCASLIDMDQKSNFDNNDPKILYVEEIMEAKVAIPKNISNDSLFAAANDSVFQKAISLYKNQREEIRAMNGEKFSFMSVENQELVPASDHGEMVFNDDKPGELDPSDDQLLAEVALSKSTEEKAELSTNTLQKLEMCSGTTSQEADEPVQPNSLEKSEDLPSDLRKVKMEVDSDIYPETQGYIAENESVPWGSLVQSDAPSFAEVEDMKVASDFLGNCSANGEEEKMVDMKCGPLVFSDVSSGAVMPESIESGSVNLSRIHHSPESTH